MLHKASLNELPALNTLLRQSKGWWGYDESFLDLFMGLYVITPEYLSKNPVMIYSVEGRLTGFYSFEKTEAGVELIYFFIHPDYVQKGFGRKMWGACCQTCQALGASDFTLWADPHAEPFYTKMGCQTIMMKPSPIRNRMAPMMRYCFFNNRT